MASSNTNEQIGTIQRRASKVGNLGVKVLVQKYVVTCQITVNNFSGMEEVRSLRNLEGPLSVLPRASLYAGLFGVGV